MKLITLLMIAGIIQVSAATFAQKVTLKDKNASLKDVFNQISNQTGYDFVVTSDLLQASKPITIEVDNAELSDVLHIIFDNQPLDYTLQEKTVVVSKKNPGLFDKAKAFFAQVTVTGKVTNELGDPMPGATVKQKGTDNTAITGKDGYYKLTVPDDNTYIDFSYVGYETQELQAKDITPGSIIKLKAAETNLQEVVINKGYYHEKQELSTGDVSVVTAKTIEEQPVTDPIQALEGRVPGLQITQTSGIPGAYAQIEIRGQNSIANGNDPLYIVDGVPFSSVSLTSTSAGGALGSPSGTVANMTGSGYGGGAGMSPFNALNPNDIETIEVLKDADATAIYGARGANGVILITTKKGKAGTTHVEASVQSGASSVAHTIQLLNTQQYLAMRDEAFKNDGFAVPNILTDPSDANYDVDGVWNQNSYTNWEKVLIGNTDNFTNAQIDLSGGSANTQFRIGMGFNTQGTVYPGDYSDRKASGSFSLTHSSSDQKFHAQFTMNYVYDDDLLPTSDFTSNITFAPDAPAPYNPDGSLNWALYNGSATWSNPLGNILNTDESITHNLLSSLNLSYEIVKGLQLKSSFGYNNDQMIETGLGSAAGHPPPNNNNPDYRSNQFSPTSNEVWNIEPQLSYQTKIAKGQLDVLLGNTFEQDVRNSMSYYAYGFSSDALISNPQAASNLLIFNNNHIESRYSSLYGRIGYNWEEKYLLNITARRDGSSRFGPGKEFGNFGAVGTGWIFSKEKFVQDAAPWLSFGKLRASYGTTGNYEIPDYQYLSTYTSDGHTYQGNTGLYPTGLSNPYFAWEVDKKLESGIELGFLQNRINLTADYYRNRTSNQLVSYTLPSITGFGSIEENLPAVVQNTGAEFSLNTVNVKSKNFTWSSSFNMSIPSNKLVSYPGLATSPYQYTYIVGQPLSINRVYQYTGINPQTGTYTFETNNTSGFPSYPQDLDATVNVSQKFYGGFQNSFQYKRFQLDIFLEFVEQTEPNYIGSFNTPGSFNSNEPVFALNTWQYQGSTAPLERLTTGNAGNAANQYYDLYQSNYYYSDGSFIRLKNVSFSYKLPENLQNTLHLKNLRVYIQGQNLLTFTHYLGLDPETHSLLPPLRTITAGLQASL